MADLAKSSSVAISNGIDKSQKAKPEKPDEQLYKDRLSKAEREHAAAQEKVVRLPATPMDFLKVAPPILTVR